MSMPPLKAFIKVIEFCKSHDCDICPLRVTNYKQCGCYSIPADWKLKGKYMIGGNNNEID